MDAVTSLKKHINIHRIMEFYRFEKMREDGGFIRSCCGVHGGNNASSFVANTENGLWFCHTQCGAGDAFTLVQRIEKCSFPASVKRVAEILGVDIANMAILERKAEYITELAKWTKVMKAKGRAKQSEVYRVSDALRDVAKFRSFHPDTLEAFGLKYAESVQAETKDGREYTLHNRLYVPIHNEFGVTIGASFRATKAGDMPKWSHQPRHIKTSDILYNYDRIKWCPEITVVEGIFDTWAYHEIGVPSACTYGAHLSEEQYKLLMRTGADIVLSYDGDEAGRIARSKAVKLLKNKCNLYVVDFDEGADPESISRDELRRAHQNKRRV